MRTISVLAGVATLFSVTARGQQLSPDVLAAQGGTGRTSTMTLDWTLGETAVESLNGQTRLYTQGFHQPLRIVHSAIPGETVLPAGYQVLVTPNPVQSLLQVRWQTPAEETLTVSLLDMHGHQVLVQQSGGKQSSVMLNLTNLAAGIYVVDVRNQTGLRIRQYKVVKSN